jgi:hypothetical protein
MSDTVELEVEWAGRVGPTAYVTARVLEPGADFTVEEGSTLAGAPLHAWLDVPRALDAQGSARFDLFAFALQDSADLARFAVGQRVTLVTPG